VTAVVHRGEDAATVRQHADVVVRPVTLHRELRDRRGRVDDVLTQTGVRISSRTRRPRPGRRGFTKRSAASTC
jgi:hypothetical protein